MSELAETSSYSEPSYPNLPEALPHIFCAVCVFSIVYRLRFEVALAAAND